MTLYRFPFNMVKGFVVNIVVFT